MPMATSSAATARLVSGGLGFGTAHATTAKRPGWLPPLMPQKLRMPKPDGGPEYADARFVLHGHRRDGRHRLGVHLSGSIGRTEGGEAQRDRGAHRFDCAGAHRTRCAEKPPR